MKSVSFFGQKAFILLTSIISGAVFAFLIIFAMLKLFYPVCYLEFVKKYSNEYNIDSAFVLAIINTESGFDRFAISSKGAIGLMQIVPATANSIAKELSVTDFNVEQLYDAEVNIKFGCYYLNYLSKKFNSTEEILFAYNAGEGRLQKFLNENNGVFALENIQIAETENYILKVNRAYLYYKNWHNL